MLHIILGILKIVGMIAGIMLLLFLAILMALLLVPVRYKVRATGSGTVFGADGALHWLLYLFSLKMSFGTDRHGTVQIRLFGIRLPFFRDTGKNSRREASKVKKQKKKQTKAPVEKHSFSEKQSVSGTYGIPGHQDTVSDIQEETDWISSEQESDKKTVGNHENILFKIRSFSDKIEHLLELIRRGAGAAAGIPEKIRQFLRKIDDIRKKPGQLLDLMDEYEIPDLVRKLKKELIYLMKHYAPRRILGYLEFGTGDPALTGELTGLIYLLLPAGAGGFEIRPDFYEAKLETEFTCTGHIRGIHLIFILVKLLMDRQVRRVIGRFIKKGD